MAIRREDQSLWERRAPLGPQHVRKLIKEGVKVIVQPSNRRAYPMQVTITIEVAKSLGTHKRFQIEVRLLLKTVAFIAGKKNPAIQKKIICFSIENFIENISLYALSWPKLNFGCYLTFEIIF